MSFAEVSALPVLKPFTAVPILVAVLIISGWMTLGEA